METLTSRDNPSIKLYRRLCTSRKDREENGLFVMEGARLCEDAAESGIRIVTLLLSEEGGRYLPRLPKLCEAAEERLTISEALAHHISDTEHPQGVFAIGAIPAQSDGQPRQGRCLLLDGLQDPGNLGTVIRTAESLGIDHLILSAGCPDIFSPKVIRATMGSCFRQKIHLVEDLPEAILALRSAGMKCYAATLTPDAIPLQNLPIEPNIGIVVGNEGNGVTMEAVEACDGMVYIPMAGSAESLNAAVAAALCMWQISGQYIKG